MRAYKSTASSNQYFFRVGGPIFTIQRNSDFYCQYQTFYDDTHELKSEGFEYKGNFSEGDFHGNGKLTYEFKNEVIEGECYYGHIWNGKTKDKSGKILCKWVEGDKKNKSIFLIQ